MVEAAIYFPVAIIILFIIILLSLLRLNAFRTETKERSKWLSASSGISSTTLIYTCGGTDQDHPENGMNHLPTAAEVERWYDKRTESFHYPGEVRFGGKGEKTVSVPSLIQKSFGLSETVKGSIRNVTAYGSMTSEKCRIADMLKNSYIYENLLGYDANTMIQRMKDDILY